MNYLIITNDLSLPIDEGVKKVAYYVSKIIGARALTLTICTNGKNVPSDIKPIKTNRLFISTFLKKEIIKFKPDRIIYISKSFTIVSFLRAIIIKNYSQSNVLMLALSDSISNAYLSFLINLICKFSSIDIIITPSPGLYKKLFNKIDIKLCPLGVDIIKFRPINLEKKIQLRNKYGIANDLFTLLHVGHITKNRNLEALLQIQNIKGVQVLVVCSESVTKDKDLFNKLNNSKLRLIAGFIEDIEEIYQLSDCYIFPTNPPSGAIPMPLSVLEAMACNLPVITTKFGILPLLFKEEGGVFYFDSIDELIENIHDAHLLKEIYTRELVKTYTWERLIQTIEESF